jgi:hypothetical protein
MGRAVPEKNSDETLASASTNPTPQQDGATEALRDDKESILPGAAKAQNDVRSHKGGSTGPRSEAGKRRSSRNAFKHGIFAKVILVPGESIAMYRLLLGELRDGWQPEGAFECFLTEMIASNIWRLRRHHAAESAEIRRGREFVKWDEQSRQTEDAERIGTMSGDASHLVDPELGLIWEIRNPIILGQCLELLLELQREIKAGDFEYEIGAAILQKLYGTNVHLRETLYQSYLEWTEAGKLEPKSQRQGCTIEEEFKKYFLSGIAKEIRRLRDYQREKASIESERMKLEFLRCNVPGPEHSENLIRYELTLTKNLERIANLLERTQRLRRGQPVAPRIDVNLSA